MAKDIIRIGTRDSELATWQATTVSDELKKRGFKTEIIFIKSEGDLDLTTPLIEMGGKGVFTKALDEALLQNNIDLAVHSYKDLPTENPLPLIVSAVLEREDPRDTLVAPKGTEFMSQEKLPAIIATGSNRRKAQWLHKFPGHTITNIRGNVNTRLKKLHDNGWDGAIFAAAGLNRINLSHHVSAYLDWMVPAPAQGAMAVMIRENDQQMLNITSLLNHPETALCTSAERDLLNEMEAGCSAPVGAHATIGNSVLSLYAVALKTDGSVRYEIRLTAPAQSPGDIGRQAARELLEQGAGSLLD